MSGGCIKSVEDFDALAMCTKTDRNPREIIEAEVFSFKVRVSHFGQV